MIGMILYATGIATSVGLLVAHHVTVGNELWAARRETSRFPLFDARANLVMLVASGTMDEDEPAWCNLYQQVNFLLRMDQQLDLPHFIKEYIKFRIEVERDMDLRANVETTKQIEAEAAQRVPEFAAVRDDVNRSIMYMVDRRTRIWHWAVFIAGVAAVGAMATAVLEGRRTIKSIARAVRRPSSDDFIGWADRGTC